VSDEAVKGDSGGIYRNVKWSRDKDSYVLRNAAGLVLLRTKQPAILYDSATGKLFRYGDYERVAKHHASMRSDYAATGDMVSYLNLSLLTSKTFNVDDLNKCLVDDGHCKVIHERLRIQ
jgi:hypothetical protein